MIIALFGPPGAGKSTVSRPLVEKGWVHVAPGDILRQHVKDQTEIGLEAAKALAMGKLVPVEYVWRAVAPYLANSRRKEDKILLDAFPRSMEQVSIFESHGYRVDKVLNLVVSDDTVVKRLMARGRADDIPEIIRERFNVYHAATAPTLDYYRSKGLVVDIDGEGTAEDAQARVNTCLSL